MLCSTTEQANKTLGVGIHTTLQKLPSRETSKSFAKHRETYSEHGKTRSVAVQVLCLESLYVNIDFQGWTEF